MPLESSRNVPSRHHDERAQDPRQNGIAAALRDLGQLERALFTLDWIDDPELRRATGQELNKGETRNSRARAVFLHRFGKIRDRTYANQHRASGAARLSLSDTIDGTRARRLPPDTFAKAAWCS